MRPDFQWRVQSDSLVTQVLFTSLPMTVRLAIQAEDIARASLAYKGGP